MSVPTVDTSTLLQLRDEAEARLKAGTAPTTHSASLGADALCLLYQLSSNPNRAGDALKLLHELQVHQVELDLQSSQLTNMEAELIVDLLRYRELFHLAPMAYFLLDLGGVIVEGNRAAGELMGVDDAALNGCRFETYVAPGSMLALRGVLKRLASAGANETCALLIQSSNGEPRQMQVMASLAPLSGNILLACCPSGAALLI